MGRIAAWEETFVKTPYRVGDIVKMREDLSPEMWVFEGSGMITAMTYNPTIKCADIAVQEGQRTAKCLAHHLADGQQRRTPTPPVAAGLPAPVVLEKLVVAKQSQQKRAATARSNEKKEKKLRDGVEADAEELSARVETAESEADAAARRASEAAAAQQKATDAQQQAEQQQHQAAAEHKAEMTALKKRTRYETTALKTKATKLKGSMMRLVS